MGLFQRAAHAAIGWQGECLAHRVDGFPRGVNHPAGLPILIHGQDQYTVTGQQRSGTPGRRRHNLGTSCTASQQGRNQPDRFSQINVESIDGFTTHIVSPAFEITHL
jgi:hypothetical protein